jgi:putative transposase
MPAIRRGKMGGIKQYLKGRNSYKTHHTMTRSKDNFVTFDLWIICKYRKGQRGKHGVEYLAFVVHQVSISLNYVQEDYRRRFGIESSYRLKNLCRIKTTNKKPALRLLFVCLSFLLVNIWVRQDDLFLSFGDRFQIGFLTKNDYHSLFFFPCDRHLIFENTTSSPGTLILS